MPYHVITRTYIEDPSVKNDLLQLTAESLEVFKKQPGLIEIKSLLAENETHVSSYMVWKDQQSHLACMESKDFKDVTIKWTEFMQAGRIKFELETYQLID